MSQSSAALSSQNVDSSTVGIVSHHLRNPLAGILLAAGMLLRRNELDAPDRGRDAQSGLSGARDSTDS